MEYIEERIVSDAKEKNKKIAAAESCTGGLICSRIVNVSGASDCFLEGFVTYSNEAKMHSLGVDPAILASVGAVSSECAAAMAKGAADKAGADIAVSTTGIAGPLGGTREKPVGLVYIGGYDGSRTRVEKHIFDGDRKAVREAACERALELMYEILSESSAN